MSKKVITVFLLLSIAILGIYPKEIFAAAASGVNLWFNMLLPAVFPSMVIVRIMSVTGVIDRINLIFGGFMRIFGMRRACFEAFSGGFLSGFPTGGKITGEMLAEGKISKNELKRLFMVCNNPGIFFITSAVGAGMLKSRFYGLILLVSAVIASILTGMIYSSGKRREEKSLKIRRKNRYRRLDFFVLKEILMESMDAITRVGGFIILFSVISRGVGLVIPLNDTAMAVFSGIMEMTGGLSRISALEMSEGLKLSVISAVTSFGGFSVIGQCISMVPEGMISVKDFVFVRAMNGAAAFFVTFFIVRLMGI